MESAGDRFRIREGCRVVLRKSIYGYEAGARGVVLSSRGIADRVLVRLDGTGHGVFVSPEVLDLETDRA
jgi:hypothetical protein